LLDKSASDLYFLVTKQKNKRKNQMRNKITMEMSICQAGKGFSLNELVKKLADAFENKAFAGILKMNFEASFKTHLLSDRQNFVFVVKL
jgi:hypothetical protein